MNESDDEPRRAIMEAAGRLLASEGPAALTIRRLAMESGGSTMNVYSRFGGKEGVVDALFIEGFTRLTAAIAAMRKTASPLADLRRCAKVYRQFAVDNRTYYAIMFDRDMPAHAPSIAAQQAAMTALDMLAAAVQRAIDARLMIHADAKAMAADLWATNHGLVSLELRGIGPQEIDWPKRHDETMAALVRGLSRPDVV